MFPLFQIKSNQMNSKLPSSTLILLSTVKTETMKLEKLQNGLQANYGPNNFFCLKLIAIEINFSTLSIQEHNYIENQYLTSMGANSSE